MNVGTCASRCLGVPSHGSAMKSAASGEGIPTVDLPVPALAGTCGCGAGTRNCTMRIANILDSNIAESRNKFVASDQLAIW